jgi:hypothetical protein
VPRVEETSAGGNRQEGNPFGASTVSTQVQTQTVQNIAQGDSATPLETGRDSSPMQRAAEAKAARAAALAKLNRERQQRLLRDAPELTKCLNSGMGLLDTRPGAPDRKRTNNEPMEVLRSLNERLDVLREENPQASNAELAAAAKSAVQALIPRAKNAKEWQQKPVPWQTLAAFKYRGKHYVFQNRAGWPARKSLDPLPAGHCGERAPRSSRCTPTSVASGPNCTRL